MRGRRRSDECVDVSTLGIKDVDKMGRNGHAPAISKPARGFEQVSFPIHQLPQLLAARNPPNLALLEGRPRTLVATAGRDCSLPNHGEPWAANRNSLHPEIPSSGCYSRAEPSMLLMCIIHFQQLQIRVYSESARDCSLSSSPLSGHHDLLMTGRQQLLMRPPVDYPRVQHHIE